MKLFILAIGHATYLEFWSNRSWVDGFLRSERFNITTQEVKIKDFERGRK